MSRILHSRLILLRPNVLAAARQTLKVSTSATATAATLPASDPQPSASRTETALRAEVSALCLHTAVSAIEMLHDNLCSASRILSSNAAFVTLSAATVIIAASLVPELEVSLEREEQDRREGGDGGGGPCFYGDVVAKAILVLEEHRWQFEGAAAARGQLEKFLATIIRAKRMRKAGESFTSEHRDGILLLGLLPVNTLGDGRTDWHLVPTDGAAGSRGQGGDLDAVQKSPEHLSSPPEFMPEFDFSDPLWSFQWGGPAPMFDAQDFTFSV